MLGLHIPVSTQIQSSSNWSPASVAFQIVENSLNVNLKECLEGGNSHFSFLSPTPPHKTARTKRCHMSRYCLRSSLNELLKIKWMAFTEVRYILFFPPFGFLNCLNPWYYFPVYDHPLNDPQQIFSLKLSVMREFGVGQSYWLTEEVWNH